jgi:hypothetical protein
VTETKKTSTGWYIEKRAGQTVLYSPSTEYSSSGIDITINKGRRTISVGGWYDSVVGISSHEIPIDELMSFFEKQKKGNA